MFVENPVRETYEEIKSKYNGYCAFIIKCDKMGMNFGTGIVLAYHEDLSVLMRNTLSIVDEDDVGIAGFSDFFEYDEDVDCYGPIHVEDIYE
ncbi:MAG: hypothetical protein FWC89_09755 [Defluviitaleaceae bacterium]|nr:hypothetical protein [Defluviitaleaceae bacterium]